MEMIEKYLSRGQEVIILPKLFLSSSYYVTSMQKVLSLFSQYIFIFFSHFLLFKFNLAQFSRAPQLD